MSIANEIKRIKDAKAAIKQSIENKGVTVGEDVKLDKYADYIDNIEIGSGDSGGGSGDSEYVNPDFYELRTKGGTNYRALFYHYAYPSGSYSLDLSHWDTSKVTDASRMFYYCNSLTSLDLSNWDTSNMGDMSEMFYNCQNLTELNVKHFNTRKVDTINGMFHSCSKLISLDLSGWRFREYCNSLLNMFYDCSALISVNLTDWDTSNIVSFNNMFYNCKALTTIIGELDTSKLTSGLYPGSSSNPFYKCTSLETLYLKNIYKDCTLTNASKWSINLKDTKVKDECLVYIINELPDLINDKGLTATDKIVLTLTPTNTLTADQVQVAIDKGWQVANTTY